MSLGLLLGQELTGGLHHILGAHLAPGNVLGVHLSEEGNLFAVDDDGVVGIADLALELTVHGIVTEHVGHIVRRHEGVVDADKLNVRAADAGAEHQTTDPAKAINANFDAHNESLLRSK